MADRYGRDVLADSGDGRARRSDPDVTAEIDLVLEDPSTGFCGAIVRIDRDLGTVTIEDRRGVQRGYPFGPGFWLDGRPVVLIAPPRRAPDRGRTNADRTASGSIAVANVTARVARDSRIFVEGRHDAELVEQVWGDDLRIEGVVVELLDGVDLLTERLTDFAPGPGRRVGVLVDHLVRGSKEQRIADSVAAGPLGSHVLVVGHPFVDIWQAVRPASVGIPGWPVVPRGEDWKTGTLRRLGWPAASQADVAAGWRRIRGSVRTFADLDPALLGRVEELIDFVTDSSTDSSG